jgi:hypothetical protein
MPEVLWVLGVLLALGALGMVQLVPWPDLMRAGYDLMLNSAGLGIPLELVYFVSLAFALKQTGNLVAGWYWRPFMNHHLLTRDQKLLVLPWFVSGALAFVGIVFGIGITLLGMVAAFVQSR